MAFFSCLPDGLVSPVLQESLALVVLLVALSSAPASLVAALPRSAVWSATAALCSPRRHKIESNVAASTHVGMVLLVVLVLVTVVTVVVVVVVPPAMADDAAPNA